MESVMNNNDLRRYIFSFLRKYPKKKCYYCDLVCVWDKEVNHHVDMMFFYPETKTLCLKCHGENFRCTIT